MLERLLFTFHYIVSSSTRCTSLHKRPLAFSYVYLALHNNRRRVCSLLSAAVIYKLLYQFCFFVANHKLNKTIRYAYTKYIFTRLTPFSRYLHRPVHNMRQTLKQYSCGKRYLVDLRLTLLRVTAVDKFENGSSIIIFIRAHWASFASLKFI